MKMFFAGVAYSGSAEGFGLPQGFTFETERPRINGGRCIRTYLTALIYRRLRDL